MKNRTLVTILSISAAAPVFILILDPLRSLPHKPAIAAALSSLAAFVLLRKKGVLPRPFPRDPVPQAPGRAPHWRRLLIYPDLNGDDEVSALMRDYFYAEYSLLKGGDDYRPELFVPGE